MRPEENFLEFDEAFRKRRSHRSAQGRRHCCHRYKRHTPTIRKLVLCSFGSDSILVFVKVIEIMVGIVPVIILGVEGLVLTRA
jgi:hypothetical protein